MRTVLLILFLQAGLLSVGQEQCASVAYAQEQKLANAFEAKTIAAAEKIILNYHSTTSRIAGAAIIKIPVVVHVVYNKASQNIPDAQIQAQVDALTRDFRRLNSDTVNTPDRFRAVAADVQIEFYLATADPKGRPTNGIVRKYSGTANWLTNDKIKFSAQGGDDGWDNKSYLNIWVGNLVSGNGYSSPPGSEAGKDGIVINVGAFSASGRVATHEVGHWLGLRHIWGDAACGDDLVEDTPPQSTYTLGCPSGFRSTCNNGALGDMYMNYMDYTSDACMNLFTDGQKQRMLATFKVGGPRESLLQSKGLKEPWVTESALDNSSTLLLYPNPALDEVTMKISVEWIGKTVFILNSNGILVQTVQIKSGVQKLSLSSFKAGIYFIRVDGATQKLIKL